MGQYYIPVVMRKDKTMTFYSWDYDNGLKLMEHSWLGNDFVNAVYTVITDKPAKVAWVGDYSCDVGCDAELYALAWGEDESRQFTKIEPNNLFWDAENQKVFGEGYLINHTKRQFIDMKKYAELMDNQGWVINPLPLLTAIGNGLGGGDYRGNNQFMVGYWFMNELEYKETHPDYSDITTEVDFEERRY